MPAIPLIELNDVTSKFRVNSEAASYLQNISGPLAVVSCAGMYRTGKSSFLNRVLLDVKGDEGFGVGQTVQACTKGLWMHTDILRVAKDNTGENVMNVLVIDTEGLGAFNATSSHDSRIFSLALLLSSYFIYNSVGMIDEQAISTLSLVANISKLVKTKSDENDDERNPAETTGDATSVKDALEQKVASAVELGKLFPDFLWVVRDFSLQLKAANGTVLSPNQYLEQALRDKTADGSEISEEQSIALMEKNHLRSLLRAYFPRRQCVTMVRPCANEADLQRIDTMPKEEMRPEFLEIAKKVRTTILRNAPAKTVANGKLLSGRGLVRLCETYVEAMNSGVAPVIRDSWALLTEVQFRDAVEAAEEHFEAVLSDMMNDDSARDPTHMDKLLVDAEREALRLFSDEVPERTGPMYDQFRQNLCQALDKMSERARQKNLRYVDEYARNLLEKHVDNRQFETWKSFIETALNAASDKFFEKTGLSSHAKSVWARLALPRVQAVAQTFGDKFDLVHKEWQECRESALKAAEWKEQVQTLEEELRAAQTILVESEAQLEAEKEALEQQLKRAAVEIDTMKSESREADSVSDEEWRRREQLLREETHAAVAEAEAVAKQASLELERLKENSEETRSDFQQRFETLQSQTEKSLREMKVANEREIDALQSQAEEFFVRAEDAESKLEVCETNLERTKRKYDDTARRFEECESKLSEERSKHEQVLKDLHEKWRKETKSQHEEKLELTRAAKVAEAKLALQERELASLREKMQEERPNVEAERAIAALERVEQESQRIRTELFEVRRALEEERANLRKMERQLRDQQSEHELAQHNLKMNYEVQAAQERAQAAVSRRGAASSVSSSSSAASSANNLHQSKRAKLY